MADNKPSTGGPKTTDSKRDAEVTPTQNVEGANQNLQDMRSNTFGDNTSSTGGANNPGQHGRDGGEIDGTDNNPAPSKDVIEGERADDTNQEG
jgi:hypothetical protein